MALCGRSIDELAVGHVGEWDLSNGDLKEHKVFDAPVWRMVLSGDMMVVRGGVINRVFSIATCLLMLSCCSTCHDLCHS